MSRIRKIKGTLKRVPRFLKKNKAAIMSGASTALTIGAIVEAAKAAPIAKKKLEEAEQKKGDKLTVFEKICTAGPDYVPAFLMGVTSVGCTIGAAVTNSNMQRSLAGTAMLMEHKYHEYRQTNIEENGIEADVKVRKKIAEKEYIRSGRMYAAERADEQLFYEPITDTWFVSTMEDVKEAHMKTMRNCILKGAEDFIFFLDCLGILTPELEGTYRDWRWDSYVMEALYGYQTIDMDLIHCNTDELAIPAGDGKEYYILEFPVEPESEEALAEDYMSCGIDSTSYHSERTYQEAIELDDEEDRRKNTVYVGRE